MLYFQRICKNKLIALQNDTQWFQQSARWNRGVVGGVVDRSILACEGPVSGVRRSARLRAPRRSVRRERFQLRGPAPRGQR
jgi:hypothetical protein